MPKPVNALLIYPEMPDSYSVMKHALEIYGTKAMYPPVGLLTVAAMLPQAWNIRLVDLNVDPLTEADLAWADYAFVSAMTVQAQSVKDVIAACKAAGVPIVAGGPLFTHEHHLYPEIDHFVLNEAEITLKPFLEDLEAGTLKPIYQTTEFADVTETPIPRWDLVEPGTYQSYTVQYSRGCPYMCDFCDVTALFGRRPRIKSPEQIIAELEALGDLDETRAVLFADDNLIGNKKHVKHELLPALIQWRKEKKPRMYFATQLTINLVDDEELMDLMLEAGFGPIFIGLETPDDETLLASQKRQNMKRDLIANIRTLHSKGFLVSAGFIVGFDTDDPTIFDRQIQFIQDSGVLPIVNILKAPPGTELHERMEREGRLLEHFVFDEYKTNILPKMDLDTLYEGFGKVIGEIYTPQGTYERILNFLRDWEGADVTTYIPPRTRDVAGLALRAFWQLGVVGPERPYFWKTMAWVLRNKPHALGLAVFHLILMRQMHRIYQNFEDYRGTTLWAHDPAPQKLAA